MRACECSVKELDCSDVSPTRLTGAAGCIFKLGRHMGGCSLERKARRRGGSAVGVLERPGPAGGARRRPGRGGSAGLERWWRRSPVVPVVPVAGDSSDVLDFSTVSCVRELASYMCRVRGEDAHTARARQLRLPVSLRRT
jgi:hypothetical protein